MANGPDEADAYCYLLSFPFWVFVDRGDRPSIRQIEFRDRNFRVYPPFRSAPDNWLPMPAIRAERIPYRDEVGSLLDGRGNLPKVSAFPYPEDDPEEADDGWTMHVSWGEEAEELPTWFYPTDSLRVDVWGHEEVGSEVLNFTQALLEQLRLQTKQWWIGRSVAPFLKYQRNTVPITVNGRASGDVRMAVASRTGEGDERVINSNVWERATEAVEREDRPPAFRIQLLDARYYRVIGEIRRCVLECAIALEDATRLTYERLWPDDGAAFQPGRVWEGSGPPDYLSDDLDRYAGRSYEDEHPDEFETIEDLWDARGNIAHGRETAYRRDGKLHEVDQDTAERMEKTTEECVSWLMQLDRDG